MQPQEPSPPDAAASRSERPPPHERQDKIHLGPNEAAKAAEEGVSADVGGTAGADLPRGG